MPVSWLPGSTDLKNLGGEPNLPPISFAPPPTNPRPQSAPIDPMTAPGQGSSILSPFGPVAIPGVSVPPGGTSPLAVEKKTTQPTSLLPPVTTAPTMTRDQMLAAAAASAGKAAAGASTAASTAGQQQEQAQAAAQTAAAKAAAESATKAAADAKAKAAADAAAAAASAGKIMNSASTAASTAGQKQEQAQGAVQAGASTTAAKTASTDSTPKIDPVSGLPVQPAGTPKTVQTSQVPVPTGMDPATPTTTTNPDGTPAAPSVFNQTLTKYMDTLNKWAEGMPDQQYKNALNQIITSSALMDQAEMDALKMQINQDPNLRGQGAGLAMMQVMARDHGFNLDQALAKASGGSLERIISMQKYGIEKGAQITGDIRAAKLEDARIALENAQQARENTQEDINTLKSNGQFDAAAAAMNEYMKDAFPGLNLNITGASLKSRDPQELTKMTQKLNFIKDLVGKNRAAAVPIIQSMMTDPSFDGYFPEGLTAEQIADTLATGQVSENISQANIINTQINSFALPGADGKSASFDETGNLYDEMFKLQGRNAVKEGQKLDVEDVNAIRAAEGLPAFSKDAQGNMVDENGIPLDDEDFKELAYRKDFYDKQQSAATKPWVQKKNLILDSPLGKYFTDEKLYPGANDSLEKFLMATTLAADAFTTDPQTGEIVPNWDKLNLSLSSPEMWPIFHNWPMAVFNEDGTVKASTPGGYVYGEPGPDGQPVLSTPEDQSLDSAYFAYRSSGGALNPSEWYYATRGGKAAPDPTKIPAGMKTGEDFTNVGAPGTSTTTNPDGTPKGKDGTVKASQEAFDAAIDSTAGGSQEERDTLKAYIATVAAAYASAPATGKVPLSTGHGADFDAAVTRLRQLGMTQGALDAIVNRDETGQSQWGTGGVAYKGTQAFADYTLYAKLLNSRMNEADAKAALNLILSPERAKAALQLESFGGGTATKAPSIGAQIGSAV